MDTEGQMDSRDKGTQRDKATPTRDLGQAAQFEVVDVGGKGEAQRSRQDGHARPELRVENLSLQHVVLQHLLCQDTGMALGDTTGDTGARRAGLMQG